MENRYIILDSNKQATHKFKDGKGAKKWSEVKDFDNVALIVPKPYIVLDFDTTSDAEIMLDIINSLDLKCRVMKTTRGIHVWFKSSEESPKNFIKNRLAIGVYSDRKVHSRNAYVKIKSDGELREWIKKIPMEEIEEVPKWLSPISAPSDKFAFKGMGDGDGRNQELFNYIVYLQAKGFKKDEVKETIEIINEFVFEDPLTENEIALICRDEAFKPDDVIEKQIAEAEKKVGFSHNEFGDELINKFNIIETNGQLYVYDDGYYQKDEKIIERKMIEIYPSIKTQQRNEVLNYIKIKTHVQAEDIKINPYIINLKNTRLDIRSGKCLEFTSDAIEFDRIPVTYDESAYNADVDKLLNRVFMADREVINLFEEMLGSCLIKNSRYQKAFMLFGSGSNGKSTVLNMIKKLLGANNYASIELDKLTERFNIAELEHKLANIGDDVNNNTLKDTGTLKKLFSGDSIQVERKGERPFTLEPYATHIFSANELPRSFDKTLGFYRRWCFIGFNAKFTKGDEDYDPLIGDKVTTDEALSYLLNMAIRGAKRLINNGVYTEPESVKKALEDYQNDNSTTLSFIEDKGLSMDDILDTPTDELYSNFVDWCKLSGVRSNMITGKKTFYKEIIGKYDFESKTRQRGDGKRYFVIKID